MQEQKAERDLLQSYDIDPGLRAANRLFLRAGYTDAKLSKNCADGSFEPGVSVYTMIYAGDGWIPDDPLQGDVNAGFDSARTFYLVTGADVIADSGEVLTSKSSGKVLQHPLQWLAIMRYSGTGRKFSIESNIPLYEARFRERKGADQEGSSLQSEAIAKFGAFNGPKQNAYARTAEGHREKWLYVKHLIEMTWDRDWWAYDPNAQSLLYKQMSDAIGESCTPRFPPGW